MKTLPESIERCIPVIIFLAFVLISCGVPSQALAPTMTPLPVETESSVTPMSPTRVATSTPVPTSTSVSTPALGIGSTEISSKDGMTLLYVPAGEFLMGSTDADTLATSDEKPQHTVMLDAYWIDQTEVTNAQYAKCVADNGACEEPIDNSSSTHSSYYGNSEFDNYPVIYVDWNMASSYCSWAGRELPTETEWEKAARGIDGNIYPWGNTFDGTVVNFCDVNCSEGSADTSFNDGYADVSPVGNYRSGKSIYGAYDMAGNVWEWVNDWYDVYPGGDPAASKNFGQKNRVLRGGSWDYYDFVLRSASRNWDNPGSADFNFGFRCARGTSP
jgi:formylglycine-generating enzyme required for sulfatase activity